MQSCKFLHLVHKTKQQPMKIIIFLWLLLASTVLGYAREAPLTVPSKVEAVTVFLQGAQVARTVRISLRPGDYQYRLENLSPYIDPQSIRVKAPGDFIIKSVFFQRNYLDSTQQSDEQQALAIRLDSLRHRIARQQANVAVLNEEEALLMANRTLSGANESVSITQLEAVANFFRTRLTELKHQQTTINFALEALENERQRVAQQQNRLSAQPEEPSGEIIVTVLSEQPETVVLEVSYTVGQASWYPTYDVRVTDVESPVRLVYKANVHQRTGEDWNEVKLTFSNANPQQNNTRPILSPWLVDFYRPAANRRPVSSLPYADYYAGSQVRGQVTSVAGESVPGANVMVKGTTVGTVANVDGYYQLALPQNAQALVFSSIGYHPQEVPVYGEEINVALKENVQALEEVVVVGYEAELQGRVAGVAVKESEARQKSVPVSQVVQPTTVSFSVAIPYTIPSDGENYTVDMQNLSIPAAYEYFCAPKLGTDVFLTALVTDWEQHNLMAGEANIFFEDTFVGRSVLDVDQPSDTLTVSLGKDLGISVSRTRMDDYTEKNFFGTSRRERTGYEIALRSNKAQTVRIVVKDQVPVSTHEQIRITPLETTGADYDHQTGLLTWSLELPPAETKRLELAYEVKYPKGKQVVLD